MVLHVLAYALEVLEVLSVTELVELIKADGLVGHLALDEVDVLLACCNYSKAAAREGNLRGRSELEYHIRIASLLALLDDVQQVVVILGEMVYAVCVIPENAEILSLRLEVCKTLYNCVGISNAGRVGVHRNAPDTLDLLVLGNQLLYSVHVRTVLEVINVDHLDTERLADSEVSVIAGSRAEELHMLVFAPGLLAAEYAKLHCTDNDVVHHLEAGVAAYDDLVSGNAEHFLEQSLSLGDTVEYAVVAAVDAVAGLVVAVKAVKEHVKRKVELLGGRLTSRHIELQTLCLVVCILLLKRCLFSLKLFFAHL